MIWIDVAMVLFVALTPGCLQILKGWQVGGGAQRPQGSLFKQASKSPEGLWTKQSLFVVGKSIGRQEVKPRALLSQSQIPGVIFGRCVLRSAGR